MTTTNIRTTTLKIDSMTRDRVKRLADARQRSAHWVMLEAIREYVEREERREAFRQQTLEAWDSYRHTGLHVTTEEADAWLAELEAGRDVEPPACHD